MNTTAYLVAFFDVSSGVPVFLRVQTVSEASPTVLRGERAFVVAEARGRDYSDALRALHAALASPFYGWARAALVRQEKRWAMPARRR